jgi:hypothetical protein
MGSGTWSTTAYASYSTSLGKSYDISSGRIIGQEYTMSHLDPNLDPRKFTIRECVNSDEHPNTIPVILALDVTGSMGNSCKECAEALGVIMSNLYKKYKDIEFCVMGIGDLAYDNAPIQMSQFESDVRIAECLDKIYMEHGGGGNSFESYTAAWYMGLNRTKLDANNQGRKGIIITMGDEELNPYLPKNQLNDKIGSTEQSDIETPELYLKVIEKFDVFHIAVNDTNNSYIYHRRGIEDTFGHTLGNRLKVSTVNDLSKTIEECIDESIEGSSNLEETVPAQNMINENGEITW